MGNYQTLPRPELASPSPQTRPGVAQESSGDPTRSACAAAQDGLGPDLDSGLALAPIQEVGWAGLSTSTGVGFGLKPSCGV